MGSGDHLKEDEGMRNAILISVLTIVLMIGAASVTAGPPVNGTYKSTLGQFDEGREGSSWAGGGFLSVGNVLHAESWDGGALGGDWKIVCPLAVAVILIDDSVIGGNGHRIYMITYAGGYVELGGAGPWAGGDASYTGSIDTYAEFRTIQYVGGVKVGSDSDHSVNARLNGYTSTCVVWGIGNGVWRGEGALPAGHPAYLDPNCGLWPGVGHFGDIRDLTISIHGCAVATEEATWGSVKALYRE
jgi:hypothetical protein